MIKKYSEKELRLRIDFIFNEIKTNLRNQINLKWNLAFSQQSQKYSHQWEAFKELLNIIDKESKMGLPYDNFEERDFYEKRDKAVDILSERLLNRGSRDYHPKQQIIVKVVESLLR